MHPMKQDSPLRKTQVLRTPPVPRGRLPCQSSGIDVRYPRDNLARLTGAARTRAGSAPLARGFRRRRYRRVGTPVPPGTSPGRYQPRGRRPREPRPQSNPEGRMEALVRSPEDPLGYAPPRRPLGADAAEDPAGSHPDPPSPVSGLRLLSLQSDTTVPAPQPALSPDPGPSEKGSAGPASDRHPATATPAPVSVVIVNAGPPGAAVEYVIDGIASRIESGQQQRLAVGSTSTILYDRGGDLGEQRYALSAGAYEFRASGTGWASSSSRRHCGKMPTRRSPWPSPGTTCRQRPVRRMTVSRAGMDPDVNIRRSSAGRSLGPAEGEIAMRKHAIIFMLAMAVGSLLSGSPRPAMHRGRQGPCSGSRKARRELDSSTIRRASRTISVTGTPPA